MPSTLIRLERVKKGMKIYELARAIGYHPHYVGDVEKSRRYASPALQNAIAGYYGRARESLFNERGFALETA